MNSQDLKYHLTNPNKTVQELFNELQQAELAYYTAEFQRGKEREKFLKKVFKQCYYKITHHSTAIAYCKVTEIKDERIIADKVFFYHDRLQKEKGVSINILWFGEQSFIIGSHTLNIVAESTKEEYETALSAVDNVIQTFLK